MHKIIQVYNFAKTVSNIELNIIIVQYMEFFCDCNVVKVTRPKFITVPSHLVVTSTLDLG